MTFVNVALGSLSMVLAGCHVQKQAASTDTPVINETEQQQQTDTPVIHEPEPVVCKYGVPAEVYEMPKRKYGIPDYRGK